MSEKNPVVTFGTPAEPSDNEVKKNIVKDPPKEKKKRKKKICGHMQVSPIYRWICELKPNHDGEHDLIPHKRIIPGLEIKKKKTTNIFNQ